MAMSKIIKNIVYDMDKTIAELHNKGLIRDDRRYSQKTAKGGVHEISFPGSDDRVNIVYDKHIDAAKVIDTLLEGKQYNILLYDKSLIQAEFKIKQNSVIKERLVFMKKHNKIWDINEIEECEILEEDWFAEERGIPIILRVDYDPQNHIECDHANTHLTISNHESCRIPIKDFVTFSEFVRLVLFHFYNIKMDMKTFRINTGDMITKAEKEMIHMSWE